MCVHAEMSCQIVVSTTNTYAIHTSLHVHCCQWHLVLLQHKQHLYTRCNRFCVELMHTTHFLHSQHQHTPMCSTHTVCCLQYSTYRTIYSIECKQNCANLNSLSDVLIKGLLHVSSKVKSFRQCIFL
jgi:hypothetical protein